jgi:hypothetical protein
MRRLDFAWAVLAAACLMTAGACKREDHSVKPEQQAGPASVLAMGDPRSAVQLTRGFYDPEQASWRWTSKEFSAVLRSPAGSADKGARLIFKFALPETSIRQLQSITLSAKVRGTALDPETYTKSGNFTYQRDIPASVFTAATGDAVAIDFALDKALPPAGSDLRQLGVVAQSVGLEAK